MPVPNPEYPLEGSCSTLFNNTLYTYTPQAFQSLPLVKGAAWSELPMGVSVQGGVCVKSTPKNDTSAAALYIVGGTSSSSDYPGLQKYTFGNGTWETIRPTVTVTQNRLYHNAVYLNASDSILVFAGTQDGAKQASSQTFTIQASEPYTVTAYEAIAPPAVSPILLQYSNSKAIYIGGSESNTMAMIFSPSKSWVDSNVTLANPVYNTTTVKAIMINGDDASKTLYTFDMSTAPNVVNRTIIIDENGNPVQNAKPVVYKRAIESTSQEAEESASKLKKRGNLTVQNWPAYNDSLAPSSTRTQYSIAQDQSGLVVISGGNMNDALCMFKARDNCWANATDRLTTKTVSNPGTQISSSSTSTTPSSNAQQSSTAAASTSNNSGSPFPTKVLGAVVGSIVGAALIFIALLIFFRWQRKRKQHTEAGHQRRSSGIPNEKSTMDFADRGLPQMASTRQFPTHQHQHQDSQGSFSSMAILMGRVGHKRGGDNGNGSDGSSQFNQKYKTAISKPIVQEQVSKSMDGPSRQDRGISFAEEKEQAAKPRASTRGGRRGSTRRSSGWNRYWSGGSGLNILGFGSKRSTYESNRSSGSQYSEHRQPSQITQKSAVPPPLNLIDRPELSRVTSGSPTIAFQPSRFPIQREMSGRIERSGSISSASSYNDDRHDAFSSGVPASVHDNTWTPIDRQDWAVGNAQSTYSASNYTSTLPQSSVEPPPFDTRFPPPQTSRQLHNPNHSSDMSWLNLGGDANFRV